MRAGDLASLVQTRTLADKADAAGPFGAVIHDAAVGPREKRRIEIQDGLPHVFPVATLAPYVLTALMQKPRRLVYVGSELHRRGDATLHDLLRKPACGASTKPTATPSAAAPCWPSRWRAAGRMATRRWSMLTVRLMGQSEARRSTRVTARSA